MQNVPDPGLEKPTDALIEIEWAGLCGSDMHPFLGREAGLEPGTIMGHEAVGKVLECGTEVSSVKPGDRVVVPFTTNCGNCLACQSGLTARCQRGQLFGWRSEAVGLHGLQAEAARIPLADATLMPMPVDWEPEAALFWGDVLATGYYAWSGLAPLPASANIAIVGAGPVGLCATMASLDSGQKPTVFDLLPHRLETCKQWGAGAINVSEVDLGPLLCEFDGVIEAVGSAEAQKLSYDLVRPGGTISTVGVHTAPHFAFSPADAYDKNLTFKIGRCPARGLAAKISPLLQKNRRRLSTMISHKLALSKAPEAYETLRCHSGQCGKIAFAVK